MSEALNFDVVDQKWLVSRIASEEGMLEFVSFVDGLYEPRFTLKQAGIKKQDLSYWKHEGLYENRLGAEGREWTRLSFFDYIWLRLVVELRKVNVPIKSIAELRSQLFTMSDEGIKMIMDQRKKGYDEVSLPTEVKEQIEHEIQTQGDLFFSMFKKYFSNFSFLVLGLMIQRRRLVLTYTPDGRFNFLAPDEIYEGDQRDLFLRLCDQPHASVPMHNLMSEFFVNPFVATKEWQRVFGLTPTELKIVEAIREKGSIEVRVKLRPDKGGYLLMETLKHQSVETSLREIDLIIKSGGYKNISVKSENGSIKVFEVLTKQKI
jgi:hypothetical protein